METQQQPPDWIANGVRSALGELRLFFSTAAAFIRQPDRFAVDWAEMRRHALNPFAFLATAVALLEPLKYLVTRYLFDASFGSLWFELSSSFGRYLMAALFGLLFHPFMRLGGSRQPLRATLGLAMYTGGAAVPIVSVGVWLAFALGGVRLSLRAPTAPGPLYLVAGLYLFPLLWYLRALVALHGLRWRTALIGALTLIVAVAAVLIAGVLVARSAFHYHPPR